MPQKKNNTNTKKGIFDFEKQPYIVVLFLIIVPLLSYIVYRIQASEQNLISYGVLFIVAGVIFEGRRLSESWKHLVFLLSYLEKEITTLIIASQLGPIIFYLFSF